MNVVLTSAQAGIRRSSSAHIATKLSGDIGVVALLLRRWSPWLSAWALHLLIDIPTHARQAWAPRIGWPLLDWRYDGVSWVEWSLRRMRAVPWQ
jgi:hypothetical protein